MVVRTTFADPTGRSALANTLQHPCRIYVVELTDGRHASVLGVVGSRTLRSPDDTEAWLRSMMSGLDARGFAVTFNEATPMEPGVISISVALRTAWIATISTSRTANVVLHVRAWRAGSPVIDSDYRGALTTVNWFETASEWQGAVNHAFAKALDIMAPDLRRLCPA